MDLKKIITQALVGAILFTIISVILEGTYGKGVWIEKGQRGLLFGGIYAIYLLVKYSIRKKE